jgi:phospholipase C
MRLRRIPALMLCCALAACAAGSVGGRAAYSGVIPNVHPAESTKKIQHIVIMIQENRSFDNFFATFPGADGTKVAKLYGGGTTPLKPENLERSFNQDLAHGYPTFVEEYDGGKMDGFSREGPWGLQYVKPKQIQPYWEIARRWVLGDHMFQTTAGASFTAHQDLIAGGALVSSKLSIIDIPSATPWGCDAPPGTVTSELNWHKQYLHYQGPFPCLGYRTMANLLDAKGISWKYYVPQQTEPIWDAFDAIAAVRCVTFTPPQTCSGEGREWQTNIVEPETTIYSDVQNGTLPAVSWVIPDSPNSDHPGVSMYDTGPSWIASVVNAIGQSPEWNSTAIIIVWDDWGGFYDHVPPPQLNFAGLGFRVPMLVVSPYDRVTPGKQQGYISHTQFEFGSILRFIEDNWGLGTLGTADARATSLANPRLGVFDFTQAPRSFKRIPAQYSKTYFMHQKPSNVPLDSE